MPTGRSLHGRRSIGRSLQSAARAWGLGTLSLRETIWFYGVALITAALLFWSPSRAAPPEPPATRVAAPLGGELSSEEGRGLGEVVRGFAKEDRGAGPVLFAAKDRRATAHSFRMNRNHRAGRRLLGRATIRDVQSMGRPRAGTAVAQPVIDVGIKTPTLRADGFADSTVDGSTF